MDPSIPIHVEELKCPVCLDIASDAVSCNDCGNMDALHYTEAAGIMPRMPSDTCDLWAEPICLTHDKRIHGTVPRVQDAISSLQGRRAHARMLEHAPAMLGTPAQALVLHPQVEIAIDNDTDDDLISIDDYQSEVSNE